VHLLLNVEVDLPRMVRAHVNILQALLARERRRSTLLRVLPRGYVLIASSHFCDVALVDVCGDLVSRVDLLDIHVLGLAHHLATTLRPPVLTVVVLVVDDDGLLHFGEIVATDHCLLAPILVSFEEKLCVLPAVKIWLTRFVILLVLGRRRLLLSCPYLDALAEVLVLQMGLLLLLVAEVGVALTTPDRLGDLDHSTARRLTLVPLTGVQGAHTICDVLIG